MYRNQYYWKVGISFVVSFCYATSELLVKPHNTSAIEGQRVQLNCSTSDPTPISWQYVPVAQGDVLPQPKDVFLGGGLVNGYQFRFEMHGNRTEGVYNLVIPAVQLKDAGTYRCRDQDGTGEHVDVILNVTENTDLHIAPVHAETQVGASVQLICITFYKTEPVNWQHIPLGKTYPVDMYISGNFVNDYYNSGYEAQMNRTTGANSLIITSVKSGDGGLYRCIEKEGHGQNKDAELTVIDAIDCNSFPTVLCGTLPRNMTLECNMTFSGKFAPLLQWVTTNGDVVNQGVTTTNHSDRVTSTMMKEVNDSSLPLDYTCQAAISRASCQPNDTVHCQTEEYDSTTHSIDPKIEPDTIENNQNLLYLLVLLIPIVGLTVVAIVVLYRRRNSRPTDDRNPTQQELQDLNQNEKP